MHNQFQGEFLVNTGSEEDTLNNHVINLDQHDHIIQPVTFFKDTDPFNYVKMTKAVHLSNAKNRRKHISTAHREHR